MKRALALALVLWSATASADGATPAPTGDTGDDALFTAATAALHDGRPADAIADLESLGDRGVVDPVVSYDRGLAYAERIRAGGEQPGDLGRAAEGLEEACDLSKDKALSEDATRGLTVLRGEVARRRARAGEPAALEQGPSLGRAVVHLVPEDAWAVAAALASLLLAGGLFVRRFATSRRARIGGTIASAAAGPLLVLFGIAAAFARDDRLHLREGIIVVASARPSDEHGIVRAGSSTIPEAARVQIVESKAGWARVRWGSLDAWIPSQAVRPIASVAPSTQDAS